MAALVVQMALKAPTVPASSTLVLVLVLAQAPLRHHQDHEDVVGTLLCQH